MRRDAELLRTLLLDIEQEPRVIVAPSAIEHVRLLMAAGYVEGAPRPRAMAVTGLTWKGHELLAAIRTEAQWVAVKVRAGAEAPFGILESVAFDLAANAAGLEPVQPPRGVESDARDEDASMR